FADQGGGVGVLSGTPGPNAAGVYPLVITASSQSDGSRSQGFTLTVELPSSPAATSFAGSTPDGQAAFASLTGGGSSCRFSQAAFISEQGDPRSPQTAPPSGTTFPKGLFNFVTTGCDSSPVAITLRYPQALPGGTTFEKYGPRPGPLPPDWYALDFPT